MVEAGNDSGRIARILAESGRGAEARAILGESRGAMERRSRSGVGCGRRLLRPARVRQRVHLAQSVGRRPHVFGSSIFEPGLRRREGRPAIRGSDAETRSAGTALEDCCSGPPNLRGAPGPEPHLCRSAIGNVVFQDEAFTCESRGIPLPTMKYFSLLSVLVVACSDQVSAPSKQAPARRRRHHPGCPTRASRRVADRLEPDHSR